MANFLEDLWMNIQGYYEEIIELLPKLTLAILVFLIFYFVAGRAKNLMNRYLLPRMDDPLLARFLARMTKGVIAVTGLLIFLKIVGLGALAGGLLASAGVGAFIIGFAFKDIGENLLGGVMLAFNRPFKVGDIVELEGVKGKVMMLSLRNVQIKTHDGRDVFIPNASVIKKPVINYTIDGDLRYEFTVGIDYDSDIRGAIKIILDTIRQVKGIMMEPRKPAVAITNLGASTLNMTAYYWIDAFDKSISAVEVKNEVVNSVLEALTKAGYYLPGDVLEIKNYKESELKALNKVDGRTGN